VQSVYLRLTLALIFLVCLNRYNPHIARFTTPAIPVNMISICVAEDVFVVVKDNCKQSVSLDIQILSFAVDLNFEMIAQIAFAIQTKISQ
jgi:hypothetical protein